jgi:hypothetical protein
MLCGAHDEAAARNASKVPVSFSSDQEAARHLDGQERGRQRQDLAQGRRVGVADMVVSVMGRGMPAGGGLVR